MDHQINWIAPVGPADVAINKMAIDFIDGCGGNLRQLSQEHLEIIFESDHQMAGQAMHTWKHVETFGYGMP